MLRDFLQRRPVIEFGNYVHLPWCREFLLYDTAPPRVVFPRVIIKWRSKPPFRVPEWIIRKTLISFSILSQRQPLLRFLLPLLQLLLLPISELETVRVKARYEQMRVLVVLALNSASKEELNLLYSPFPLPVFCTIFGAHLFHSHVFCQRGAFRPCSLIPVEFFRGKIPVVYESCPLQFPVYVFGTKRLASSIIHDESQPEKVRARRVQRVLVCPFELVDIVVRGILFERELGEVLCFLRRQRALNEDDFACMAERAEAAGYEDDEEAVLETHGMPLSTGSSGGIA